MNYAKAHGWLQGSLECLVESIEVKILCDYHGEVKIPEEVIDELKAQISKMLKRSEEVGNEPSEFMDIPKKEEEEVAKKFWDEISKNIPEWQLLLEKKITPVELRKEFVHSTTNSLNALGIVGRVILQKYPENWKEKLRGLKDINWSRNNSEWEGRLLLNGRMLKTTLGIELAANTILKKCGIPLSENRLKHENRS